VARLRDRLKKKLGQIVPDEAEDWLSEARDYLSNPTRALSDVARTAYRRPITGQPGTPSLKTLKRASDVVYRDVMDPVKEAVAIQAKYGFDLDAAKEETRRRARDEGADLSDPFSAIRTGFPAL